MVRLIYTLFLCVTAWGGLRASSVQVSGSKIALSEGNVLGAAFYDEKGIFLVQQSVLSTEKGGLVIRFHRQLSSWNVKDHSPVAKRAFEESPHGASPYPCGRIGSSPKLRRMFLCSAGSYVEVIDPETLATLGRMAQRGDQSISDIAVDDHRNRLFVLASRSDGSWI